MAVDPCPPLYSIINSLPCQWVLIKGLAKLKPQTSVMGTHVDPAGVDIVRFGGEQPDPRGLYRPDVQVAVLVGILLDDGLGQRRTGQLLYLLERSSGRRRTAEPRTAACTWHCCSGRDLHSIRRITPRGCLRNRPSLERD